MKRLTTLTTVFLLCLGSHALTQQKQQVSSKVPAGNSKYVASQNVDVRGAPNHIMRLFDTRATIPHTAATVNALKLVEVLARGIGDLTDGHGGGVDYFVFVAENGDNFFFRNNIVAQQVSGKLGALLAAPITGGTVKFVDIQGAARQSTNFDPSPDVALSNSQFDVEYSIGK
jgi:hypothetical protein